MPKTKQEKACDDVLFWFEVMRCQLPAGHDGYHEASGLRWQTGSKHVQMRHAHVEIPKGNPYQAELRKRATLKEG